MKKDVKGFTLVELMVVVAIIGILSAIAVPNFKKYQGKARRAEANVNLATIYTLEQSFYADYNTYSSDLTNTGTTGVSFDGMQSAATTRYYSIGFGAGLNYLAANSVANGTKGGANAWAQTRCGNTAFTTTSTSFKAGSCGYILGSNTGAEDVVSIDESKTLSISAGGPI